MDTWVFIVFATQSVARNESGTMMIHGFNLRSIKDDLGQGGAKIIILFCEKSYYSSKE